MTIVTYGSSITATAKSRRHARRRQAAIEREALEKIIDAALGVGLVSEDVPRERRVSRVMMAVKAQDCQGE